MLRSKLLGAEGTPNVPGEGDTLIAGTSTASFIGAFKKKATLTAAGVGAFVPVPKAPAMDFLPGAAVAYGFRRLRTGYTTNKAVRIRRSSDNTESDIGFDANGDFDTSAFNTFIGAGDGFVKTWYDQSGNGLNATQATNANQPKVVLAAIGGKPGALFGTGTAKALVVASGAGIDNPFAGGGGTINGVWRLTGD